MIQVDTHGVHHWFGAREHLQAQALASFTNVAATLWFEVPWPHRLQMQAEVCQSKLQQHSGTSAVGLGHH